jgi:hypothetical protein
MPEFKDEAAKMVVETTRPIAEVGVSLRKLPGAANAVVATGHNTDRLRHGALSGVPQRCADGALTRRYTTDCGSWQLP